jgi:GT2 family glycosyltransferase
MSFWKNDLIEINGFDEQYTGWGKEDSDIVYRLIESGKKKVKLKFAAVQYHLFHKSNDRSSLLKNDHILNETISLKRTHARVGLIELP